MAWFGRRPLRTRSQPKNFRTSYRNNSLFLISILVSAITLVLFLHHAVASSVSLRSTAMSTTTTTPPAFSLLVTARFETLEHKGEFLEDIKPLAEYVRTSEPDTIAYEVLLSDKDPLEVMILERYKDKENAFIKVHRSSAPFLAFRPKLKLMQEKGYVTLSGHSYLDSGVGFGDRAESRKR